MENLSKIAQGIFLGNGEVWNFLDYAVNRNCGGLLKYTRAEYEPKGKKNYLISNISKNFNEGKDPRYKYDDIQWTESYDRDGVTYADTGIGGNIGSIYSVPEAFNSDLKFLTKEEYKVFQKQIRNRQIFSNGLAKYKNNDRDYPRPYKSFPLESYAREVSDAYSTTSLSSKGLGDDVDIQYIRKINTLKQYTLLDFGKKAKDASDNYQTIVKDNIRSEEYSSGYTVHSGTVESYNGTEVVLLSEPIYKVRKVNDEDRIYKALKPLLSVAS